jgi:hypothetical protein
MIKEPFEDDTTPGEVNTGKPDTIIYVYEAATEEK